MEFKELMSESINELVLSLCKARAEIGSITKDKEVNVTTKDGRKYNFKYATLDTILESIKEPLAKNQLLITHFLLSCGPLNNLHLITQISHSSGQWMRSFIPLILTDIKDQSRGSAITFARRYAVSSILSLATDEDDDANAADGNESNEVTKPKKPEERLVPKKVIDQFMEHHEISEKGTNYPSLYVMHLCTGRNESFDQVLKGCASNPDWFQESLDKWIKKSSSDNK